MPRPRRGLRTNPTNPSGNYMSAAPIYGFITFSIRIGMSLFAMRYLERNGEL